MTVVLAIATTAVPAPAHDPRASSESPSTTFDRDKAFDRCPAGPRRSPQAPTARTGLRPLNAWGTGVVQKTLTDARGARRTVRIQRRALAATRHVEQQGPTDAGLHAGDQQRASTRAARGSQRVDSRRGCVPSDTERRGSARRLVEGPIRRRVARGPRRGGRRHGHAEPQGFGGEPEGAALEALRSLRNHRHLSRDPLGS